MKKLTYTTPTDLLENFPILASEASFDDVAASIYDTINQGSKTAKIYEIHLENSDFYTEITLPTSQWIPALKECIKNFEEKGNSNKAFEAYMLIKRIEQY